MTKTAPGLVALALALLVGGPPSARGQDFGEQKWGNFHIIEENDTLLPPGIGSDELYTQGFRLVFMRSSDATWRRAMDVEQFFRNRGWIACDDPYVASSGLVFGQTMFTPRVITTLDPDPADRPYAGYLYGGVRIDMVREDGNIRHSFEANGGLLGPPSLAETAQSGIHVLRKHRIPKGWHAQVGPDLGLIFRYAQHRRYGNSNLDVTPGAGFSLGTVQTTPFVEAVARAGWNLTGMPLGSAPHTAYVDREDAMRAPFEIGVLAGFEGRYFLRNEYIEGRFVGSDPSVPLQRGVLDLRYGLSARVKRWRLTYQVVRRSREIRGEEKGHHHFGSLAISRELPQGPFSDSRMDRGFWTRGWLVEGGVGRGRTSFTPDLASPRAAGPAGRVGFTKQVWRRLQVGAEMVGVVREGGPPDATGAHRDDFLVSRVVRARLNPFSGKLGPGNLHLRLGAGSGLVKREQTRAGIAFEETEESGAAVVAGADYAIPASSAVSIGLDAAWSRIFVNKDILDHGHFLSLSVVVQFHP